jgi:hypothetical protein
MTRTIVYTNSCVIQDESMPRQVMTMRQSRFRALVSLDPVAASSGTLHPRAREYPSHTRALVILARPLRSGLGPARYLRTELWQDDETPFRAGDRAFVTVRVTDDRADDFLGAGQRFALWSGGEVGHGTICRKVFTDYGPIAT